MPFIDQYIVFEMTLLADSKFLDVFQSVSVLLVLFNCSLHGPVSATVRIMGVI